MIDGIASDPFSAKGLPPLLKEEKTNNEEEVIRYSREKYANRRNEVEETIMAWHQSSTDGGKSGSDKKNISDGFSGKCSVCGIDIVIPFKPDGIRPLFCPQCLAERSKKMNTNERNIQKKNDDNKKPIIRNEVNKKTPIEKPIVKKISYIPPQNVKNNLSNRTGFTPVKEIIDDKKIKTMSLNDLRGAQPVKFSNKKRIVNDKKNSEQELKEGEDVILDN